MTTKTCKTCGKPYPDLEMNDLQGLCNHCYYEWETSLPAENERLKNIVLIAAKWLERFSGTCPSEFDWDHPETCDKHCFNASPEDCWHDWLMQSPEPPEESK